MGFGWSGAGAGAANALEQILAQQLLTAQAKQREQETAKRLQMDETRLNAQLADAEDDRKFRTRQEDRIAAGDRDKNNRLGVRRMIGESLMQRTGPMTPEDRRSIAALQVEAGDLPDMSLLTEPEDKPIQYTYTDPKTGNKSIRFANRNEIPATGLDLGNEPRQPRAAEKPQYIQVTQPDGTLKLFTPEEIRAAGGVQTGKGTQPDPNKAADVREKILTTAKALRDSKGRENMTGNRFLNPDYNLGLSDEPRGGSPAANAKALYDTLKSVMTLENISLLKGAMSDKDLLFLQSAGSSLNDKMDDPTFAAELDKIIQKFEPSVGAAPEGVAPPKGKFTILKKE